MASYAPIGNASFSMTSFSYSPLLSDGDDVVSRTGTVASGIGILKRGAILKVVPATGVITVPVAAVDCNCVLANDVDATSATVSALIYLSGKMKADAIIWPGALSHADVADALRNWGILIESVVFTDGTLVKSLPRMEEQSNAVKVVEHNREEENAARSAEVPPEEKPSVDSPWAYLTPEEREKNPELAEPPTIQEIAEAGGEGGTAPTVTLSPTSDSLTATAETANFTVNKEGGGTWNAVSGAAWLTVVAPTAPQSTSGTVTYAVATNLGALRTGNITVADKTFTVTQSAAD